MRCLLPGPPSLVGHAPMTCPRRKELVLNSLAVVPAAGCCSQNYCGFIMIILQQGWFLLGLDLEGQQAQRAPEAPPLRFLPVQPRVGRGQVSGSLPFQVRIWIGRKSRLTRASGPGEGEAGACADSSWSCLCCLALASPAVQLPPGPSTLSASTDSLHPGSLSVSLLVATSFRR